MADWLVRQGGSLPIGPVSTELVIRGIEAGRVTPDAEVCRVGDSLWLPLEAIPEFAGFSVDDDAATRVTDSPWFMREGTGVTRAEPTPRMPPPQSVPGSARLGLPPPERPPPKPPRPPVSARPMAASLTFPSPGQNRPPPSSRAVPTSRAEPGVARHSYDDAAKGPLEFPVDDETVTRVAHSPPGAPSHEPEPGGVLPTLPMHALQAMQADLASRAVPSPRPAAGAPPPASLPRPTVDVMPPTRPFIDAIGPTPPPAEGSFPSPGGSAPPYAAPPGGQGYYGGGAQSPYDAYGRPQYPLQYPPPTAPPAADSGLRALIVVIVVLAVALAGVLIALVSRQ
jgi:GYF domain 2